MRSLVTYAVAVVHRAEGVDNFTMAGRPEHKHEDLLSRLHLILSFQSVTRYKN